MTISLKHKFQSAIPDVGDPTIVQPSNWNDEHALVQATATMLGRVSAGDGVTEELSASQVRTLINVANGATANSSDAYLLSRANHTGTQLAATISDFSTAADARVSAAIGVSVQAYSANLALWSAVVPSSYLTTAAAAAAYQPLDSDLTSWASVTRASGFDTFAGTGILPIANGGWNANNAGSGRLNFSLPVYVANIAALQALDTTKDTVAIVNAAGVGGTFIWTSGNFSTQIATDTRQGVYVKATAIAATAGAWVRTYTGPLQAKWFGQVADGVTDDQAAINAAISLANFLGGGEVKLAAGTSIIGNGGTSGGNAYGILLQSNVNLTGCGMYVSKLKTKDASTGVLVTTSFAAASSNISVADFGLDGNQAAIATQALGMNLWFYNCTGVSINNIYSAQSVVWSVRIQLVTTFSVQNIEVYNPAIRSATDALHITDSSFGTLSDLRLNCGGDDVFIIQSDTADSHDITVTGLAVVGNIGSVSGVGVALFNSGPSNRAMYNISIDAVTVGCKGAGLGISTRSTGTLDVYNVKAKVIDNGSKFAANLSVVGKIHQCDFAVISKDAGTQPFGATADGTHIIKDNRLYLEVYNPPDASVACTLQGTTWDAVVHVDYNPLANKASQLFGIDMWADHSYVRCNLKGAGTNLNVRSGASSNTFDIIAMSGAVTKDINNLSGAVGNSFIGGSVTGTVTDADGSARFYGSRQFEGYGTASITTDGSGNANIAHGLAATPRTASVTLLGNVAYAIDVQTVSSTNLQIRLKNPATNANVTSTSVSVLWRASL
ncbi:hypothetical protein FJ930_19710 [Mesorhizobium sp. B2-4-15]|uniref:glycosyl hydrolase family 28-related protein n=1 Tax=Mesorhizobium sp. B2-4-15 TaxID=2589934 RepID=UPI00114F2DA3|nr:glycosyl hydrolase family 28-related protein [Mesorhizobium sp. B2-4-15]TPK70196.1 hypothetical protein FJ930_19710 [Mesorhizobium sp. B2-4-15]